MPFSALLQPQFQLPGWGIPAIPSMLGAMLYAAPLAAPMYPWGQLGQMLQQGYTNVQQAVPRMFSPQTSPVEMAPPPELQPLFAAAAQRHNVPQNLLEAVAYQESRYRPAAQSRVGAQGVMQLMPGTARELGVQDALDPAQNIEGGAQYLARMLNQFGGDYRLALAAYNAGPGRVRRAGGIPPLPETQNYVNTIMGRLGY